MVEQAERVGGAALLGVPAFDFFVWALDNYARGELLVNLHDHLPPFLLNPAVGFVCTCAGLGLLYMSYRSQLRSLGTSFRPVVFDDSGTKYRPVVKAKWPSIVGLVFLLALITAPALAIIYSLAYKGIEPSQRGVEPPALAYLKTPAPHPRTAGTSPLIIIHDSPGSAVSFGQQGGITAGTVNQFGIAPPEPNLTWAPADTPQPENAKHPRTFGTLSVDHLYESAKFAIICDRACDAVGFSVDGYNRNCPGKLPGYPKVAAFVVLAPNPFPPDVKATFSVDSEDAIPVKILGVRKLKLTGDSGCH